MPRSACSTLRRVNPNLKKHAKKLTNSYKITIQSVVIIGSGGVGVLCANV